MNASSNSVETLDRLCAPAGDASRPPRTLVVLAHPDDETVSASSRLTRIEVAALLYVTDGAPRDGRDAQRAGFETINAYAQARRAETLRALAHAGISSERAAFLNYADQQAAFNLLQITADLQRWIVHTQPEALLTHPYEGGHPDHDAVAFAAHACVEMIAREGGATPPVIIEFTSYHECRGDWVFGGFLPGADVVERVVTLNPDARALKQRLVACYRSQADLLQSVPLEEERFRLAPHYDFTRPPHEGPPLYERHGWGVTISDWCALATDATERLHSGHTAARA